MKYLIMKTTKGQENMGEKTTESDYVSVHYSQLKNINMQNLSFRPSYNVFVYSFSMSRIG